MMKKAEQKMETTEQMTANSIVESSVEKKKVLEFKAQNRKDKEDDFSRG